jgi:hypothetical protein
MRRYLVVANLTLGGEHLTATVRQCLEAGPCSFHVLVPATPPPGTWTSEEGDEVTLARDRLEAALERFRELGAEADGEIGDARPLDAVQDVLAREMFDGIILSTLPPGISRWLGMDLVSRVERAVDVPVTAVPWVFVDDVEAHLARLEVQLVFEQLVRRVESPSGQVLKTFDPVLVRNVDMPPEHRQDLSLTRYEASALLTFRYNRGHIRRLIVDAGGAAGERAA